MMTNLISRIKPIYGGIVGILSKANPLLNYGKNNKI